MLAPGNLYRRQFLQAGRYTYSDGYGHVAMIVVVGKVYLPVIVHK